MHLAWLLMISFIIACADSCVPVSEPEGTFETLDTNVPQVIDSEIEA